MAGHIAMNTFSGGMNKDLDFSLLKENQYYDALNYKLVADEDANGFTLENAEGNSSWVSLTSIFGSSNYKLVGHCYIQPYLVLFATTNTTDKTPTTGISKIARITVDKDELQDIETIYTDGVSSTYLKFSDTYPITSHTSSAASLYSMSSNP